MELFKNTNFDFLGYKWPFIIASLVLTVAGLTSIALKGGVKYGIDFRSGAMMYVKFTGPPPVEKIRSALSSQLGSVEVQSLGSDSNEVIIETEQKRAIMVNSLTNAFGQPQSGKLDFNNATEESLSSRLRDPLQKAGVALSEPQMQQLVKDMLAFRNTPPRSGVISN